MGDIATRLDELLKERRISGYKMCSDLQMSRSFMTELRKGRSKGLSLETAGKIAAYLGVTVDYLLGNPDDPALEENPPPRAPVNDPEALEIMKEMYERRELRALFKTARGATADDVRTVDDLLKKLSKTYTED